MGEVMRKRDTLRRLDFPINFMVRIAGVFPKRFHKWVLKYVRNWDNYLGMLMRYVALRNICVTCGKNVAIFSNVFLINPEKLSIGDNVSVHPMCYIDATGRIFIGDDVSIAHSTTIMSTEHIYDDLNVNIKDQGCEERMTLIGSNVWIGAGTRVLAGSKINNGCIIAAGAVVKNDVPSNTVVGGIPARVIKERCHREASIRP
jgi:acetyltransferase-like isoleucine patch superfamily enzyme